ncbi:hypothetical protein TI01_0351 [Lysobacter sp. A03]|nr:hypothetical protein TI01_0351 [Lysobacter sp. A03]
MSNPVGHSTTLAAAEPLLKSSDVQATAAVRNDLYRGSYVGKSYLRRSRRSTAASQSMFRIS